MNIYKCNDIPDDDEQIKYHQCHNHYFSPIFKTPQSATPPCPVLPPSPFSPPHPVPPPCPFPPPFPPPCPPPCPRPKPCVPCCSKACQNQDGNQIQNLGDLNQSQGDQAETQGDLTETQGQQSQTQGNQTETQGDISAALGSQSQSLGSQTETQGDLTETMGDLTQSQGGQTQGNQTQGNQTQGDQTQTMTGHGGQTLGDQTLSNNPTITAPVTVSGVNVNVTVSCDDCKKCCEDCISKCRRITTSMLSLIKTLALTITDPAAAQIGFYSTALQTVLTNGRLGSVANCTFTILPATGNEITVLTDSLEALLFEPVATTPNIFSLLLAYLQSIPNSVQDDCGCCPDDCCCKELQLQLQGHYTINTNLVNTPFTGYVYKNSNGIVYLVDDLNTPTKIYAIPLCKILSYQVL